MTVSVTLTFEDIDAAGRAMQILSIYKDVPRIDHGMTEGTQAMVETIGQVPVQRAVQVADAAIEKAAKPPKSVKAEKPAAIPAVPAPVETTAPTAPAETASESPSDQSDALTYDQVASVVTAFSKANGRPAAVALLGKFGLPNLVAAKDRPELLPVILAAFKEAA